MRAGLGMVRRTCEGLGLASCTTACAARWLFLVLLLFHFLIYGFLVDFATRATVTRVHGWYQFFATFLGVLYLIVGIVFGIRKFAQARQASAQLGVVGQPLIAGAGGLEAGQVVPQPSLGLMVARAYNASVPFLTAVFGIVFSVYFVVGAALVALIIVFVASTGDDLSHPSPTFEVPVLLREGCEPRGLSFHAERQCRSARLSVDGLREEESGLRLENFQIVGRLTGNFTEDLFLHPTVVCPWISSKQEYEKFRILVSKECGGDHPASVAGSQCACVFNELPPAENEDEPDPRNWVAFGALGALFVLFLIGKASHDLARARRIE